MLKRPGSPRKRDNTVEFFKNKTYNNQDRIRMQKAYNFLREKERKLEMKREEYFIRHVRSLSQ